MKKLLLAALAVLAAAPGSAKDLDLESVFNLKVAQALADAQGAQPIQDPMAVKRMRALNITLTAMQDGVEIGGIVVEAIKTKDIYIEFRKQEPTSALVKSEKGRPTIAISQAVTLYPRALAPLITREAAKLILADMPVCAEKHYMARSMEVRSWLELGGDKTRLPVIEPLDGYQDPALAADFKLWLDNKSEMALYRIGEATQTKDIPQLESEAQAELARLAPGDARRGALAEELKTLEAANKRFVEFLLAENQWRQGYSQ